MKKLSSILLVFFISTSISCSSLIVKDDDKVYANTVYISHNWLSPSDMTISQGMTVRWINNTDMPEGHTIVNTQGFFNSKALSKGESFSIQFKQPGIYKYYIKEHPGSKGRIIVEKSDSYVFYY